MARRRTTAVSQRNLPVPDPMNPMEFGASRGMFESNFPVDKGSYAYAPSWSACKLLARGVSAAEKTDLSSGAAARFYRLEL